jgi:hypothetical protein
MGDVVQEGSGRRFTMTQLMNAFYIRRLSGSLIIVGTIL